MSNILRGIVQKIELAAGVGGVAITAGTNSFSSGTINFSNANGVSFGMDANSNLTASVAAGGGGGVAISAGANSTSTGTVIFSNSNGVSFGMDTNGTVTGSVAAQSNQSIGGYALGNTTLSTSNTMDARSLSFVGDGIASVGMSNGSVQISVPSPPAQTAQSLGVYAVSNTTLSTSNTIDARSLSFEGAGAVSVGVSNGSVQISAPNTIAQTNQSIGIYAVSNTTLSTSGTVDARTLSFEGAGGVSVGVSNGSVQISCNQTVAQTAQTVGLYALGNTTQNSSTTLDARTLSFNGLGIITAGFSNGSIQLSATTAAQTAQTDGWYAVGNTTQNSSTTLDARTQSIGGRGIVTVGYSNGTIQISASQSADTIGFYAVGNTTQNSSTTLDARTLSFNGLGGVTVGFSNGSIDISGAAAQTVQTLGLYAVSNTTQNSSTTLDARTLSINAYGAISAGFSNGSIDLSVNTQTNQSVGLYALGNTTQNSSTTLDARTLSFNGLGAQTVGYSNGSIQLSVPATSSLVGVNGISISTNGSTISVSYQGNTAGSMLSFYEPFVVGTTASATLANGTLYVQPFVVSNPVSAYQIMQFQQVSTQPTTTMSLSMDASTSGNSSGTGNWIQSGTVLLFSRQSTGTAAASSNLISCGSNSYSFGMGYSASLHWTTNVLSAYMSYTTSGAASFISNINSTGGSSSGSFGTSGSGTWSTAAPSSGTYSSSFVMSLASQCFSGVRPIFCPLGTSLTPGEYWLGNIISTGSASSTIPLQGICNIAGGNMVYIDNTAPYAEIGSTATIGGSNIPVGWGSYSSSGNTTTTFAMSNISNMSNNQTWFAMAAWTK